MAGPAQDLEDGNQEIGGVDQWGDYIAAINAFKAVASNSYGPPPASRILASVTNVGVSDTASPAAQVQAPAPAPAPVSDTPAKAAPSPHPSSSKSKEVPTDNPVTSHQAAPGAPTPPVDSPSKGITPGMSSAATAKNTSSTKREGEPAEHIETPAVDSNEAQNSQLTGDSDGSDEVVFRQDELRIVGPNIPYTFRKDETLKAPKSLSHVKMNPPRAQEHSNHHATNRWPSSRGRNHRKYNPPARSAPKQGSDTNGVVIKPQSNTDQIKEARRAELLAFQKKEMQRYGKKVMGLLSDESPETMPLYLARQGPGVDPDSVFCNQHPLYLLTDLAESFKDQNNEAQSRLERGEIPSTNGQQHSGPVVNAWGALGNLANAVAVDWQYRPWEKYGDEFFVQKFRNWLDKTMRIGFIVDMTQEDFRNGEYHANLDTGMGPATFVCPETLRDTSDAETLKHAHETAIGYVHNWNLRIRQEKERKEIEERERRRLAILPKPDPTSSELAPYAPKLNMYIRPVEPKDIIALVELFNWYVRNTLRRTDLEEITYDEMREYIEELQSGNYPFLVAVERHPRVWHAMNHEAEMLYGFCCISDFTGPLSTQRYACDIELFVHPKRLRLGVGSCLLDKMIEICDPEYRARGGYIFDCASQDVYTPGLSRPVMRLAAAIHHSDDEASEYAWIKKWLSKEFNFQEQGYLRGFGVNKRMLVNTGYMVYSTSIGIPESG